jgi:hypothetical protein
MAGNRDADNGSEQEEWCWIALTSASTSFHPRPMVSSALTTLFSSLRFTLRPRRLPPTTKNTFTYVNEVGQHVLSFSLQTPISVFSLFPFHAQCISEFFNALYLEL